MFHRRLSLITPPGLFSEKEKEELNKRVIQPLLDYQKDIGIPYISIVINKRGSAYSYGAIGPDGGYDSSSIDVRAGQFDYWVPDCMGPCEFSQSFKDKYPEIVKLANP